MSWTITPMHNRKWPTSEKSWIRHVKWGRVLTVICSGINPVIHTLSKTLSIPRNSDNRALLLLKHPVILSVFLINICVAGCPLLKPYLSFLITWTSRRWKLILFTVIFLKYHTDKMLFVYWLPRGRLWDVGLKATGAFCIVGKSYSWLHSISSEGHSLEFSVKIFVHSCRVLSKAWRDFLLMCG